ncbi:MAG: TlpA family protein disulfide reductase [Sphingobacterium sp.]|nr:TlpA family protein disulfide reductase [Sphingobacterium sp.]
MFKLAKTALLIVALLFLGTMVYAQQKNMLRAGDPAPELKYSKWLKGDPIESYQADHIYIVEFWATWCRPCRAAMPHLTELQKQYTGKATVIGVNIMESSDDKKPYDANLPKIETFVKSNDANMGYSVFADNNEQHMKKNWFEAAGLYGIPATFVVQNNKVLWIGQPEELDTVLSAIADGTFDMEAASASLDKDQEDFEAYNEVVAVVGEAFEKGNREEAFRVIEKDKAEMPKYAMNISFMKFIMILMNIGEKEAIAYGKEWQQENSYAAVYMLNMVGAEEGYAKESYAWVADNFEKSGEKTNPTILKQLAFCNAKIGNYTKAVKYQEEAIVAAKEAIASGDTAHAVSEKELKTYVKTLAGYKKKAK